METPSTEEVRDMLCVIEEWREDPDGVVRVKRWITCHNGTKHYLGEEKTAYENVPFVLTNKCKASGCDRFSENGRDFCFRHDPI